MRSAKLMLGLISIAIGIVVYGQCVIFALAEMTVGGSSSDIVGICSLLILAVGFFMCITYKQLEKEFAVAALCIYAACTLLFLILWFSVDDYSDAILFCLFCAVCSGVNAYMLFADKLSFSVQIKHSSGETVESARKVVASKPAEVKVARQKSFGVSDDAFIGQTSGQDEVDIFDSSSWGDEFQ